MIADKDRAWWFGASDTSMIVGNWKTATFKKWWLEKLALRKNEINTKAMKCGNAYEGKILDAIGCEKDLQLLLPDLSLRVNLDGNTANMIYEVKTHKEDKEFKVSKNYWRQSQVEMFAFKEVRKILPYLFIVAYPLGEQEYLNYFTEVDIERAKFIPVAYDEKFILNDYLPKLTYLKVCMERGAMP
ncbi:hypothetical protein M2140_001953 [Clostridiales Family XIII bacterium PM5-7]